MPGGGGPGGRSCRHAAAACAYRGVPIPRLGDTWNETVFPLAIGFWNCGSPCERMQEPKRANCAFCDIKVGAVVVVDEPTLATRGPVDAPHALNSTATAATPKPIDVPRRTRILVPIPLRKFIETFYGEVANTALTSSST